MFRTPHPDGPHTALALRLGEAALESGGWQVVAEVLEAEIGSGFALRFQPDAMGEAHATRPGARRLSVPGLGTWTLDLPARETAPDALALPLAETLALAHRLADGRPLRAAEAEAALDPLPYATIILDGGARFLFANAAGEDLLHSRRLFRPARHGARLRPAMAHADKALEGAAARILDGTDLTTDWLVRRPADVTHLAIRLRAIGPAQAPRGAARLLLTLRTIGAAQPPHRSAGHLEEGTGPA